MSPGMPLADFVHVYEAGATPDSRTLLLLHGTGGNEDDLLALGRLLDPDAALLSPRGQVLEHGMPRFFRRLAEGVFDLEDLALRTDALAHFIEVAARQYGFEPATVCAVGFSNGANIAASLLLRHPGLLRSAILFRAMVPFEPQAPTGLRGARVLLNSGRNDPIAPPAQAYRLAELLRDAGADVVLSFDDGGHALTPDQVRAAREWLGQA